MKLSIKMLIVVFLLLMVANLISSKRTHESSRAHAQGPSGNFATVISTELIGYDTTGLPRISIDTNYAYDCGPDNCWIWNRSTNDKLFRTGWGFYRTAGFNDRYLFGLGWHLCDGTGDENAFLFDLQNASVTSFCWSFVVDPKSWSPFDETIMYVNQVELFDVLTQTLTTFTPPTSLNIEDIDMYTGNGEYLWDTVTLEPVARIRQAGNNEFDPQLNETVITDSRFEICPLVDQTNCVSLFSTLDLTNADVEIWRLYDHYLLWGGHEQTSGQPTKVGINPAWRSDTVLYLTDLTTLGTQELFRYSSLEDPEYENKMVKRLEWLPDGESIAVSLLRKSNAPFIPVPTLPSGGYPILHSQAGILLIHLEWVDETPTCDHDIPASDTSTLIATITTANSSGNPTTICLAPDSTYTFTSINNNLNALPRITGDITIQGQNATITRSGATNFRFFEVEPGANLTLNDLTFSNGDVGDERGGALLNDGDLTLNSVTFDGNSATSGGAIDSESGSATITDSTFTDNTGVYGGAIDNDDTATMTISGSTFTSNHAFADAGAIHNDGATLTVSDTAFTTNTADDYAGAIDNDDGELTVNASIFTSNSADGGGAIRNDGTLTINAGSVFTTNAANNLGWGGAIYNKSDSTVVINASSFSGNTANLDGGAIRNSGTLMVNAGSSFDGNIAAQYGGAIYNTSASATLTGVEITNNTATTYDAGGVYGNSSTSITITDSIISDNASGRRGGGIWSSGTTSLTNVHLTNNTAVVEGGGIYGSSSATISAGNSCISGNSSRAAYSASSTNQNFENN